MYKQISEDIKEDYYQQNFPNDGQRFVAWYLRNIHLRDRNEAKDDYNWPQKLDHELRWIEV